MERLEIEYKFTPKEVFRHYVEFYKDRITFFSMLRVLPYITGVVWLFLIFNGVYNLSAYLITPVLALVSMPLAYTMKLAIVEGRAQKIAKQPGLYSIQHKRLITSEGITRPYGNGEVTEKWDDMYEFRESKVFYYFYYTKIEYLLIPKSAFKNEVEIEFIKKCAEKIKLIGE